MFARMRIIMIGCLCFLALQLLSAQERLDGNSKEIFFNKQATYLLQNGGIWEAVNPNFDSTKQYSARAFRYRMSKGIHGENLRIKIESDIAGVGWFTSWDGYYLWHSQGSEIVYHSLGGNGSVADGRVLVPSESKRVNMFKVRSYEGGLTHHKDVTTVVADNEMHSMSYVLNAEGDWEFSQQLIWRRLDSAVSR